MDVTARQRIHAAFRLDRALHLVWQTAPRWTLVNAALVVVHGGLPLAALYVMKRILDAVSAAIQSPGRPELVQDVWLWLTLAAGVGVFTALTRVVGEYATEAQALQVTDGVTEILHAQSIAVDLAYYEDPAYYDTLHRAQLEAPFRPTRIVNAPPESVVYASPVRAASLNIVRFELRVSLEQRRYHYRDPSQLSSEAEGFFVLDGRAAGQTLEKLSTGVSSVVRFESVLRGAEPQWARAVRILNFQPAWIEEAMAPALVLGRVK